MPLDLVLTTKYISKIDFVYFIFYSYVFIFEKKFRVELAKQNKIRNENK